jgi:5-methylcytosine-specific restriction protein A
LILALDLYFRHNPNRISKNHPEVRSLSKVLNDLPLHSDRPDAARFRNANGVYMKLCNFLRFDRSYGGKGLQAGGALEKDVWDAFAEDRVRLTEVSQAIRARVDHPAQQESTVVAVDDEDEFPEGAVLYRAHRSRERNRTLVKRAKLLALRKHGRLVCHACGFDFKQRYGTLGDGFIECHHAVAISQIEPGSKTKVSDLALLCANCHRMVHRRRPWLSMAALASLLMPKSYGS